MEQLNIDFLTQIPNMAEKMYTIIQLPLKERQEKRIQFFTTEIEPIHCKMIKINEDYMLGFAEIWELLENGNYQSGLNNIKIKIVKKRLEYLSLRNEVSAFSEQLKKFNKKKYINNMEIKFFWKYADSILEYIYQEKHMFMKSQYTVLLNMIDRWCNEDNEDKDLPYQDKSFENIGDIAKEYCFNVLNCVIPDAYFKYLGTYINLKLNYCR